MKIAIVGDCVDDMHWVERAIEHNRLDVSYIYTCREVEDTKVGEVYAKETEGLSFTEYGRIAQVAEAADVCLLVYYHYPFDRHLVLDLRQAFLDAGKSEKHFYYFNRKTVGYLDSVGLPPDCVFEEGRNINAIPIVVALVKGAESEAYRQIADLHSAELIYFQEVALLVQEVEYLVIFWDGESREGNHMAGLARARGLKDKNFSYLILYCNTDCDCVRGYKET